MKKTIAQELGVTQFPFRIKDKGGNLIYKELKGGAWSRWKYDSEGNQIYYENSKGLVMDNRPKPKAEPMTIEIDGKKYKLTEI